MSKKGIGFEYEIVDIFRKVFQKFSEKIFKVWGSGSSKGKGKTSSDSQKEGDVCLNLPFLETGFLIECKHLKSSRKTEKTFPLTKEVVDKARHEAKINNFLSGVAIKFKGVYPNSKELKEYNWFGEDANSIHIVIPISHFVQLLQYVEKLTLDKFEIPSKKLIEILSERLKNES